MLYDMYNITDMSANVVISKVEMRDKDNAKTAKLSDLHSWKRTRFRAIIAKVTAWCTLYKLFHPNFVHANVTTLRGFDSERI